MLPPIAWLPLPELPPNTHLYKPQNKLILTFHPAKSEVMELKEIENQIQLITECSSLESGTIMIFIEQHGKEQYNQALDDAAEEVRIKRQYDGAVGYMGSNNFIEEIDGEQVHFYPDKQSILNLKKH